MADRTHTPARSSWTERLMLRSAAIPGGRRARWVMLTFWIILAVALGPVSGQLQSVEENDAEAFLPAGAESLQVAQLEEELRGGDTEPAVVVYFREGGLTAEDTAQIELDRERLADRFPTAPPGDLIPSDDGAAAFYMVPLRAGEDDLIENVEAIRDLVGDRGAGLEVKVTGPAGFTADVVNVFDGIDLTLLLAAAAVVTVLLLITYRSPFLWIVPLLTVGVAHIIATATVYGLAKYGGLTVNGQNAGILPVLVFGAGTDYALLLIARYREELRQHESTFHAMTVALRRAAPAILASAGTVIAGVLCFLVADLNSTRGLGPVAAAGIAAALIAMLTFMPALLVIVDRRAFWPFVPRVRSVEESEERGFWHFIGRAVSRRSRVIGGIAVLGLLLMSLGLLNADTTLPQEEQFRIEMESIEGQEIIVRSFPAGASNPATVIADASRSDQVEAELQAVPGVVEVQPAGGNDEHVIFEAILDAAPSSQAAFDTVDRMRDALDGLDGANALVGGPDATNLEVQRANASDRWILMPLVLLVVFLILCLLLRSILAPLLLVGTVVLSFGAAMGASILIFESVFDFPALEPSIPLLAFVFLVALGVDYNIFLMSRAHEESARFGARQGMVRALRVTGGVITSAGVVLAATFAVLMVLPLVSMTQLGFIVAFGVLLDALLVRTVLVPALTFELGSRIWWPSRFVAIETGMSAGQQRIVTGD